MLRLLECQIRPAVAKGVSSKVTLKAFTLGQQGPGVEGAEQLLPLMTQTREDFNKKVQPFVAGTDMWNDIVYSIRGASR